MDQSYHKRFPLYMIVLEVIIFHYTTHPQTYPFKHYTRDDELATARIKKIHQDTNGFLWFGTERGLTKYDGIEFKNYLIGKGEEPNINDIWEDERGTLWLATHGLGLGKFRPSDNSVNWLRASQGKLPSDNIDDIFQDRRKNLWLGTDSGLVLIRSDSSWRRYTVASGLPHNQILGIAEEQDGTLWIATEGGLARGKILDNFTLRAETVLNVRTSAVIVTRSGDVLAGTFLPIEIAENTIHRYRSGHHDTIIGRMRGEAVYCFTENQDGIIFAGTAKGVSLIEGNRINAITLQDGFPFRYVYDILEDSEGTMWFAHGTAGASKLLRRHFIQPNQPIILRSGRVTCLLLDRKGNLWVGAYYDGLFRFSPEGNIMHYSVYDGLWSYSIQALQEDSHGNIWIGTKEGLNIYTDKKLLRTSIPHTAERTTISSLVQDRDGGMWIGSSGWIARVVDGKTVTLLDKNAGVPSSRILSMLVDHQGTLWMGSYDSDVGWFRDGKIHLLKKEPGLFLGRVHYIFEDNKKRIWIGTDAGLALPEGDIVSRRSLEKQLSDLREVYVMLQDLEGTFWIGTAVGLYAWSGSTIEFFTAEDGLGTDPIEHGILDTDGNLLFATSRGYSLLKKEFYLWKPRMPNVYFSHIRVGADEQSVIGKSDLNYDQNTVYFGFNVASFIDERNVLFQWMLEGHDLDWEPPQKLRKAIYANLEPKSYVFTVRAANRKGIWSEPTKFAFTINPPYWQTWWFRLFVSAFIFGAFLMIYKRRTSFLKKQRDVQIEFSRQLIERQESERSRIASELHDGLGQNILILKHHAQRILKNLPQGETAEEEARKIDDLTTETLEETRRISHNLRPIHLDDFGLVESLKNLLDNISKASGIHINIDIDPIDKALKEGQDINVYRIIQEGMNNIIRHSEATAASVTVKKENELIRITIRDNGKGFDANKLPQMNTSGFGLVGMRERVSILRGTLNIRSTSGEGTILQVTIPISEQA